MNKELKRVMDKYNLHRTQWRFGRLEIPDTRRGELITLWKELGYKTGVEVGVDRGKFSHQIMKGYPEVRLFGVDPYAPYGGQFGKNFEKNEAEAHQRLDSFPTYTFVKKSSMDALADFRDESLDFVYLDGDHEFSHVAADIVGWEKKIRIGGMISGHDYSYPVRHKNGVPKLKNRTHHVREIVDAFMFAYQIRPWFVLGRTERRPGEARELLRSWFYIKQV